MGIFFSSPKEDRFEKARVLWAKVHEVCQFMTETECENYETECGLFLYDEKTPHLPDCDPESLQAVSIICINLYLFNHII